MKRQLKTAQGPSVGYNILATYNGVTNLVKTPRIQHYNDSENMKKSMEQPFITVTNDKGRVGDPKVISRVFPASTRNGGERKGTRPVHCKGTIMVAGKASFYLF